MSMIVLYVGIAVTFMTVWGVIMVAGFLVGGMSPDAPTADASNWVTERPTSGASDLVR